MPGAQVEARLLDLVSFASVRELASAFVWKGRSLDVVVHNAGTLVPPGQRTMTADGVEETLQVHVVGPYLLSRLLLPVLSRAPGVRLTRGLNRTKITTTSRAVPPLFHAGTAAPAAPGTAPRLTDGYTKTLTTTRPTALGGTRSSPRCPGLLTLPSADVSLHRL